MIGKSYFYEIKKRNIHTSIICKAAQLFFHKITSTSTHFNTLQHTSTHFNTLPPKLHCFLKYALKKIVFCF